MSPTGTIIATAALAALGGGLLAIFAMRNAVEDATVATAYSCGYVDGYQYAGKELRGMDPVETHLCDRERKEARKHGFGYATAPDVAGERMP